MSRGSLLIVLLAVPVFGCRTAPTPETTAEAYAKALREGRLDDAWALTVSAQGSQAISKQDFRQRYSDPEVRAQHADAIDKAIPTTTARVGPLTLVREKDGWRVFEPADGAAARKVLESFLDAAEHRDFRRAYALLAAPLRARYTPERLEQDFRSEPLAKERLSRARAALSQQAVVQGERVSFPIGDGKAVQLVLEDGAWRVVALE